MEIISLLEAGQWLFKHVRPKKVLLAVENDAADKMVLREELDLVGLRYEIVDSGEEAKGLLRKERFAAALIDIGLPGMSGTELARYIRNDYPKTRIFFITGSSFVNLEASTLLRIIRKPITAHVLRELVI